MRNSARPADPVNLLGGTALLFLRAEQDVHLLERLVFMSRQGR